MRAHTATYEQFVAFFGADPSKVLGLSIQAIPVSGEPGHLPNAIEYEEYSDERDDWGRRKIETVTVYIEKEVG